MWLHFTICTEFCRLIVISIIHYILYLNIPLELVRNTKRLFVNKPPIVFSFNLSWFYKSIVYTWWDSFYKSQKEAYNMICILKTFHHWMLFPTCKSANTFTSILSFDFSNQNNPGWERQYELLKTMNITVMHFSWIIYICRKQKGHFGEIWNSCIRHASLYSTHFVNHWLNNIVPESTDRNFNLIKCPSILIPLNEFLMACSAHILLIQCHQENHRHA